MRDATPIRHRDVLAALTQWLLRSPLPAKQGWFKKSYPHVNTYTSY
jgi:hypothetical protein